MSGKQVVYNVLWFGVIKSEQQQHALQQKCCDATTTCFEKMGAEGVARSRLPASVLAIYVFGD